MLQLVSSRCHPGKQHELAAYAQIEHVNVSGRVRIVANLQIHAISKTEGRTVIRQPVGSTVFHDTEFNQQVGRGQTTLSLELADRLCDPEIDDLLDHCLELI